MRKIAGTALVFAALSLASCSGSNEQSVPESGLSTNETDAAGSQESNATTSSDDSAAETPAQSVAPGAPMSVFDGIDPNLPTAIGDYSEPYVRFPCQDFTSDPVSFDAHPGVAIAQCPSTDGNVVFTSISNDFTYTVLPTFTLNDFPIDDFALVDAVNINENWFVSPDGMIVFLVTMDGPDKVTPGVAGTTHGAYWGLATLAPGESTWTISTIPQTPPSDGSTTINAASLRDVTRGGVAVIDLIGDGQTVTQGVARDGKVLWTWSNNDVSLSFNTNSKYSTIVGRPGRPDYWVDGFLTPLTGEYEAVDPSYSNYDALLAFEEFGMTYGQSILYDNPGVFGVDFDSGFVRLPESSRLTAGEEGTWRAHVECDVNTYGNIRFGQIDDCNEANRTYITPSGGTFSWDRRLFATVGKNAVFAEDPSGFFVIGPNGEEIARSDNVWLSEYDVALTMNDQYLLLHHSDPNNWLVLRVA